MTRKSKREIERAVESLEDSDEEQSSGILITYENPEGEIVDSDGNPITEDEVDRVGLIIDMGPPLEL